MISRIAIGTERAPTIIEVDALRSQALHVGQVVGLRAEQFRPLPEFGMTYRNALSVAVVGGPATRTIAASTGGEEIGSPRSVPGRAATTLNNATLPSMLFYIWRVNH